MHRDGSSADVARQRSGAPRDAARIVRLLASGRSVLLTGPSGSGKTHVLRDVAAALRRAGRRAHADARAAAEFGGVLVADDLHRRRDLREVADLVRAGRVVALLAVSTPRAARAGIDGEPAAVVAALWLDDAVERIDLRALSEEEAWSTPELAELEPLTRAMVVRRADGSRVLLRELAIEATAALEAGRDLRAALDDPQPGSRLDDALQRHLDELGDELRHALAVLGRLVGVRLEVASRLLPVETIERALRRGLLVLDGQRLVATPSLAAAAARRNDVPDLDAAVADVANRMLADAGRWFSEPLAVEIALAWLRQEQRITDPADVEPAFHRRVVGSAVRSLEESGRRERAIAARTLQPVAEPHPVTTGADRSAALLGAAERCLLQLRWERAARTASLAAAASGGDVEATAMAGAAASLAEVLGGNGGGASLAALAALGDREDASTPHPVDARTRTVSCCAEVLAWRFGVGPAAGWSSRRVRAVRAAARADDVVSLRTMALTDTLASALAGDREGARRALVTVTALPARRAAPHAPEWDRLLTALIAEQLALLDEADAARRLLDATAPEGPAQAALVRAVEGGAVATVSAAMGTPDADAAVSALEAFAQAGAPGETERSAVRVELLRSTPQRAAAAAGVLLARSRTSLAGTAARDMRTSGRTATAGGITDTLAADRVLTAREREIGSLIAAGLSNRQIADHLVLSVRTVESHVFQARRKLGLRSRNQLGVLVGRRRAPGGG